MLFESVLSTTGSRRQAEEFHTDGKATEKPQLGEYTDLTEWYNHELLRCDLKGQLTETDQILQISVISTK